MSENNMDNETLILAMLHAREQAGDDPEMAKNVMRAMLSEHTEYSDGEDFVEDKTGHQHDAKGLFSGKGGGEGVTGKKGSAPERKQWEARSEKRRQERVALDHVEKSLLSGEELPAKAEMLNARHPGQFLSAAGRYAGQLKARVASIAAALVPDNRLPINERMAEHEERINTACERVKEKSTKHDELEADLYDLPEDSPKIERAEQRLASAKEKMESAMAGVEKTLSCADEDIHKMGLKLIKEENAGIDDEEADDEEPAEEDDSEDFAEPKHKGKGPGGGQFVSSGGGDGEGKDDEEKKPVKKEKGQVAPSKVAAPEEAGKPSTPEEHRSAINKAREKLQKVPKPTADEVKAAQEGVAKLGANKYRRNLVGNTNDRRKRREALLKEFGNGQVCPCIYCGIKIGEGSLEQDKVITTVHGGRYRTPNLVPSCSDCNKRRGDMPFAEALEKVVKYAGIAE